MATAVPPQVVEKEMAVTHAEFFRLLPRALGTNAYDIEETAVRIEDGEGRRVEIALGPESVRRIARLEVPATRVRISLTGFSPEAAAAWLGRFGRTYQKGGG